MTQTSVNMPEEKKGGSTGVIEVLVLCIAEVLGTAILLFMGCLGCVSSLPTFYLAPFSFGLTVAYAIQLFAHISGGHINPAVTIAAWVMGTLKWHLIPFYILSQFVGAFLGYGLLLLLVPSTYTEDLCVTVPGAEVTEIQALFLEIVGTGLLVAIVCTLWDPRNHGYGDSLSLKTGLMLSAVFATIGPFSGGAFNTPRGFVPSVFQNEWRSHWVYWVGPTLGAFAGSLLYTFIFVRGLSNVPKKTN